eukprot:6352625-Alexandrium_andersonii.AAC.1
MSPRAACAAKVASSDGLPCVGPPSAHRSPSHCQTVAGPALAWSSSSLPVLSIHPPARCSRPAGA